MPTPADLVAVRDSYDRVADTYVSQRIGDLTTEPWLRAALTAFAEQVRGRGPVLDIGCGPGTTTRFLSDSGVDVSGADLSPRMIEHARSAHPGLRFDVCSATDIATTDGGYAGLLGWWSLFNLPRDAFRKVISSFARALRPGGLVLIGTHVGDGEIVRSEAYGGVPVQWTTHLWRPEQLVDVFAEAGLGEIVELRLPEAPPGRPQVVISARRPA